MRLEEDVLAGKFGANPESVIFTPYYPYSKGLDLGGATDLTLSAEGATLLCEGWMEPLCIENCTRVKVKGLTIMGTVLWCTFPSHQNGFGRKRLRPRLQTFARSVANVCGKGCKRLRLRRAKWAHKSIN